MLKQVADAIKREDYQTAHQLLQILHPQELDNPLALYYQARVAEAWGQLDRAGLLYREILPTITNPKLIAQTRQGIQRIDQINRRGRQRQEQKQQQAIAEAKAAPGGHEQGVLILEPIPGTAKTAAAQEFARIMHIDPYIARLQLPSRAWRLYRTGAMGELEVYAQALRTAAIPCFCASFSAISEITVHSILYFLPMTPKAQVVCATSEGTTETITFDWSEVSRRVEGLLPLFEEYEEINIRGSGFGQRKTKTLDYAQVCDLHLPARNLILRLGDRTYQFSQDKVFSSSPPLHPEPTTLRDKWYKLRQYIATQIPDVPVLADFTPFAETVLEFADFLRPIHPHIHLFRQEETPWDTAFELYSGLALLQLTSHSPSQSL